MKKILLSTICCITSSQMALAGLNNVEFINIRTGGLGCPLEKTQIITTADRSQASLIFSQFESKVPNLGTDSKVQRNISNINCNIFLDIKLPQGQKLESLEISYDIRGNASFDQGVTGSFKSFLMSSRGMNTEREHGGIPFLIQEKSWIPTSDSIIEDFLLTNKKTLRLRSSCQGANAGITSVQLQNQISTVISKNAETLNREGSIMIDTSDITGGIKLSTITSPCKNDNGRQRICRIQRTNGRAIEVCN